MSKLLIIKKSAKKPVTKPATTTTAKPKPAKVVKIVVKGPSVDDPEYQEVARYLRKVDQSTVYRKHVGGCLHIFRSGCGVDDMHSFDFWKELERGGEDAKGVGERRMPICEKCLRDMRSGARKRNNEDASFGGKVVYYAGDPNYVEVAACLKACGQSTVYRKNVDGCLHIFRSGCGVKDMYSFDFWKEHQRGQRGESQMPVCQKCLRDLRSGTRQRNKK